MSDFDSFTPCDKAELVSKRGGWKQTLLDFAKSGESCVYKEYDSEEAAKKAASSFYAAKNDINRQLYSDARNKAIKTNADLIRFSQIETMKREQRIYLLHVEYSVGKILSRNGKLDYPRNIWDAIREGVVIE